MATSTRCKSDLACEQCRRRKSKCDRVQPQCGSCARADTACVFVDERPKRGPKKGQLRALKAQVAALERQLAEQSSIEYISPSQQDGESGQLDVEGLEPNIHAGVHMAVGTVGWLDDLTPTWDDQLFEFPEPDTTSESSNLTLVPESLSLSDMMRADLDALYFERVHPFAPIIHKGRYFSWADQETPSLVRTSLRLAMWTLAAAISTQFQNLSHRLYAATRQALHKLDGNDRDLPWTTGDIQLEEIQAWLLLAYYEFVRMERHHVLLTAARAFRLVQLTQLHAVDALNTPTHKDSQVGSPGSLQSGDPSNALLEEKRRTFWLAFCFDRLLNAHDSLTFTLQEEVIYLNLPATETSFQKSQQSRKDLLAEAIMDSSKTTLTPFAENVVLAALYGRCLTHRRLAIATALNGKKANPASDGNIA
ncbi:hypothetical protein J7T55_014361 [Diaporthe amygdali]|uniref:uncharacterized protein n=1 Tax=Phomopsis amygdali TaxID=1214568 RepID=UPI0022FE24E7|nr:uncharacterized protein J7T55_014361 [Diaporthe amygdali]KAJ0117911.1 hypothetical protein J7T55_014361 [Diaporthe amygdali]